MKTIGLGFALFLAACGGGKTPAPSVPPTTTTHAKAPQSLDEGLRAQGLVRLNLVPAKREMSHSLGKGPTVVGRKLVLVETAGWNAGPTIFARHPNGDVFLVAPKPIKIVDRHVNAGCSHFAGGRGWFEEVEYDLPEGAKFGGIVDVAYEEHVEVMDYSDTQPDGSPCPPPAID